jgi:Protein of unknown function (DUF2949)
MSLLPETDSQCIYNKSHLNGRARLMELTTHPLMRFLRDELAIPAASIALAFQQTHQTPSLMPMVLWQYGLVSLTELDQILDWLEGQNTAA